MLPTLPQNDPFLPARRARLAQQQATYEFTHKYAVEPLPGGIGLAAFVPPTEEFTPDYLWEVLKVNAMLLANHAAIDFEAIAGSDGGTPSLTDWLGLTRLVGDRHLLFSTPFKVANRISQSFPLNLTGYESIFTVIPKPEIFYKLNQGQAVRDRVFAWQRLAGANPMILEGVREIPANFKITQAQFQSAVGGNDSLDAALAEGRLYLANYKLLDDLPLGTWHDGLLDLPRSKHVFAPLALFVQTKDTPQALGCFVPVAIQCHQAGSDSAHTPIFTPRDGVRWEMAKAVVQNADGTIQELVYHLGHTHLVMEAVIVSAQRHLAENHPLFALLKPHFQFTLALNDYAYRHLIAPSGAVDLLFGSTLAGSLTALVRGMAAYRFSRAAPPQDFSDRRVDDRQALPQYPYRDDALLLWPCLQRFVAQYLRLYYSNDAAVAADTELQAWIEALGSLQGGNIQGVEPVQTLEQLIHTLAQIIFTASAQHAALNYAQFPMMSYGPNLPGALYAPAPTTETPQNEENYLMLLAPLRQTLMQFNVLYQLSSVRYGKLGFYSPLHFADPRVALLLKRFQQDLAQAEQEIRDREKTRFMAYPYLLPSQIGNSIFI